MLFIHLILRFRIDQMLILIVCKTKNKILHSKRRRTQSIFHSESVEWTRDESKVKINRHLDKMDSSHLRKWQRLPQTCFVRHFFFILSCLWCVFGKLFSLSGYITIWQTNTRTGQYSILLLCDECVATGRAYSHPEALILLI